MVFAYEKINPQDIQDSKLVLRTRGPDWIVCRLLERALAISLPNEKAIGTLSGAHVLLGRRNCDHRLASTSSTSTSPPPLSPVYLEAVSIHSRVRMPPSTGPDLTQLRGLGLRRSLYSTRFNIPELALVSPRLGDRIIQSLYP